LAEQKSRNAKALATVKEKERIAKEEADKQKEKERKLKLKQEKELADKVSREHDAQSKSKKTTGNNKSSKNSDLLLTEVSQEAPTETLQSKNKRGDVEEKAQRNKQMKMTSALAKKGAAYNSKKPVKKIKHVASEIASNNYLVGGIVFCVIFALVAIFFVPTLISNQ